MIGTSPARCNRHMSVNRPPHGTRRRLLTLLLVLSVTGFAVAQQRSYDFNALPPDRAVAVFAGGCFWCMEPPFDDVDGVDETIAGYTGGTWERPTYRIVAYADTGHYEALLVTYDPAVVTYRELLAVYWINVNPFDATGQFCDRGPSYRSAIFFRSATQHVLARASARAVAAAAVGTIPDVHIDPERVQASSGSEVGSGSASSGGSTASTSDQRPAVATAILPLGTFWVAEAEHQNYYIRQPFNYRYYRDRCGRDERLESLWGPEPDRPARFARLWPTPPRAD